MHRPITLILHIFPILCRVVFRQWRKCLQYIVSRYPLCVVLWCKPIPNYIRQRICDPESTASAINFYTKRITNNSGITIRRQRGPPSLSPTPLSLSSTLSLSSLHSALFSSIALVIQSLLSITSILFNRSLANVLCNLWKQSQMDSINFIEQVHCDLSQLKKMHAFLSFS